MGIFSILFILLCISTGYFAIGVVSGGKLGSCYKSSVVLKTSLVCIVTNLLAISTSYILGRLLYSPLAPVFVWVTFSFLFLIGVRLLLESIEKSPSLNYTDIVQSGYLIKVAVQASVDAFLLGFITAITAGKMLLFTLFFSAVFTFFAMTLGMNHGHTFNKSVLGNRIQLAAGIIMIFIAVRFLIATNS